jgi:hypothetical protein
MEYFFGGIRLAVAQQFFANKQVLHFPEKSSILVKYLIDKEVGLFY